MAIASIRERVRARAAAFGPLTAGPFSACERREQTRLAEHVSFSTAREESCRSADLPIANRRPAPEKWRLPTMRAAHLQSRWTARRSDFRSLGEEQGILDVNAEISNRVLDFGVSQQDLDRAEVPGRLVYHGRLGPAKRVCTVLGSSKANRIDPFICQPGVLPRAEMPRAINAAWKNVVALGAAPASEPCMEARADICSEFELNRSARLLLNNGRPSSYFDSGHQVIGS